MAGLKASYEALECDENFYGGTVKGTGTLVVSFGAKNPPINPLNAAQLKALKKDANDAAKATAQARINEATAHECPKKPKCRKKAVHDATIGDPSTGQPEKVAGFFDFHFGALHIHSEYWYWLIESECTWGVTVDCGPDVQG